MEGHKMGGEESPDGSLVFVILIEIQETREDMSYTIKGASREVN